MSRFEGGTRGNGRWDEEEHPRGKDGRFVSGGGASNPKTLAEQYAQAVTKAAQKNAMMPKKYYSDFESSDILHRMRSGEDVALLPTNSPSDIPRPIYHGEWGFEDTSKSVRFSEKELKDRLMNGEFRIIKKSRMHYTYRW